MADVTIYQTMSLDGYITDADGSFAWIAEGYELEPFFAACAASDAVILGRTAYESYVRSHMWPLPGLLLVVLTHQADDLPGAVRAAGEPAAVLQALEAEGHQRVLVVGGGTTNAAFLRAGLVQRIVLDVQPALLGSGVRLFLVLSEQRGPITHLEFELSGDLA